MYLFDILSLLFEEDLHSIITNLFTIYYIIKMKYFKYTFKDNYIYPFFIIRYTSLINATKISWVDIWEVYSKAFALEKDSNSSWGLYYKYKLSIFNTWHVLEDRISLLFLFIIFLI
jgi:hypothetical protein